MATRYFSLGLILLLSIATASGQVTHSTSLDYRPAAGENGYEISGIEYKYQFRSCGGEVVILMHYSNKANIGSYHYNGNVYSPQQLGAAHKQDFFINIYSVTADVYNGSYHLGNVSFENIIGSFAGCFGETYAVIDMVGQNGEDKKWREQIDQLRLSNIQIKALDAKHYKTEEVIKEMIKAEEFKNLKQQATLFENQGNYEKAYELYSQAQYKGEKEAMAAKAAEMKTLLKQQKQEEKAQAKVEEAEGFAREGQYSEAATSYESAAKINPEQAGSYQQKAAEYREQAKEEEEAASAASAEQESENETEGSAEESEEEGDPEEGDTQRSNREGQGEEEEEGSSESASRRAYEEEYQRQQRQAQYWEARNQAIEQNTLAAGQLGAAALLVHLYIGNIIYANMDVDRAINFMEGPGNMVSFQAGYGVSSVPIFTNSDNETYNGSNYSSSTKTENFESFTLDLGFNMAYWPLYSPELALGIRLGAYAGHGILFQQFTMGGHLGLRGHLGGEKLQIFAAYDKGHRSVYHTPWLDPGENGSGTAEFMYHRLTVGPQFRMVKNQGSDWSTLRFLGILERNDAWTSQLSSPATFSWSPGFRFEYDQRNRFSIGAEAVFNYRRIGEAEYAYANDATFNGTLFNLTFHRRFDLYPNSALRLGNADLAYRGIHQFNELSLKIGQPGLSWIEDLDTTRFASNSAFLGFNPIGVDYTIGLYKNFGLTVGGALSYNGVRIDPSGNNFPYHRVHRIGLNVPVGLRLSVPSNFLRYFAEAGFSYSYYPLDIWESRSRGYDELWNSTENPVFDHLRSAYANYRFSLGAVIPGKGANSYIGLTYERSVGSIFKEEAQRLPTVPADILLHRLSISYALSL